MIGGWLELFGTAAVMHCQPMKHPALSLTARQEPAQETDGVDVALKQAGAGGGVDSAQTRIIAVRVLGPTAPQPEVLGLPEEMMPCFDWNACTAFSVTGPNEPRIGPL